MILSGDKKFKIHGRQLPRYLFPIGQLDDETALENILKGEIILRVGVQHLLCLSTTDQFSQCGKAILTGPESALQGDGHHKGRKPNARIMGMVSVMRRVVC
jgi:hypothetical protein